MDYRSNISKSREYIRECVKRDWTGSRVSFNDKVSIAALAREACMSPTNFKRFFKALGDTHETVHQYILRHRMQKAFKLMREGKFTFDEISSRIGFSDAPAFNKALASLKSVKGRTPSEVRNYFLSLVPPAYPYPIDKPAAKFVPRVTFLTRLMETGYHPDDSVWDKLYEYAVSRHILKSGEQEYWGMTYDDADVAEGDKQMFCACMTVEEFEPKADDEFGKYQSAAGSYAVFVHHGRYELLDSFYDAILGKIPDGRFIDLPILEKYTVWDVSDESQLVTEVYVPVREGWVFS